MCFINESNLYMIHVNIRTKIYTLKIERSLYIDQDPNTHNDGTQTKEHNPKINKTRL